ncbi:hypothetical protein DL766_001733 [Monosporascus sp. MC13-8B]|uniref:Rhodopsin domain-containing protein n=1 Tax=Monosporascus cannonballus TaxID=155416 RepID=A0ABY0H3G0_9PEZI|nr:hypothetical protein DL762_005926 [Monosporascus cannonballus]RYO91143.1 hypothetical protein DL763_005091 [Monosporascus cannonballus]RYP36976.1 hypothetical protein DL766_001733 [Monosporascus sp. MC13-8B]
MPALPTEEQVAYMLAHPDDNLIPNIIACTSICGIASIVFLALRFSSQRLVSSRGPTLSDWLLIIGWVFFAVFDVCFAMTTRYGGGKHIIYVTDPRMLQILNLANENTYCYAMAFIKLSLLSLYGSVFTSKRFRYCVWAVAAVVTTWAVSIATVGIFQCTPIAFGWDPTIPGGYCFNYGLVVLIGGIINIVTDLTILCMPIPLVWKLHVTRQKKLLLCFTFAMGGSACIISMVRLAFALEVGSTADGSWDNIPAGLLSVVELMTGILAVSIPTYRPLYRRLVEGPSWVKQSIQNDYASGNRNAEYHRSFGREGPRSVSVSAGRVSVGTRQGISVTNQIELTVHTSKGGSWVRVPDEE